LRALITAEPHDALSGLVYSGGYSSISNMLELDASELDLEFDLNRALEREFNISHR